MAKARELRDPDALELGPRHNTAARLRGRAPGGRSAGPDRAEARRNPLQFALADAEPQKFPDRARQVAEVVTGPAMGMGDDVGLQPDRQAGRMRSLREIYDPAWTSESWIGQTAYPNPNLLRRARAAIDARCPGTKLALTEYKWGPDNGVTGAIAQAELLAIFGREGGDYATRWVAPDVGTLS